MTYHFSNKKEAEIAEGFESGESIRALAQKFGCSSGPIARVLIDILGLENYKKIAKEHSRINGQKTGPINGSKTLQKLWENPPKTMIENCRKNGLKTGPENIKKMFQVGLKSMASKYEKAFKKALETENIPFDWQIIIDFPEGSYIKFAIIDFLIGNLIVEIDDILHFYNPLRDLEHDEICKDLGYKVLRFTHDEIENNLEECLQKIKHEIE